MSQKLTNLMIYDCETSMKLLSLKKKKKKKIEGKGETHLSGIEGGFS